MENCFVTYISNDRDYKGVLMLNYMLKKYKSKYNLACIALEGVSNRIINVLNNSGIILHQFNLSNILKNFGYDDGYIDYLVGKHYYGKFLMYNLTMYSKIVYLDTDLLIRENIDHLFLYDCSNVNSDVSVCYMTYDTLYNNNNKELILCSDMFNSGVVIYEPNVNLFNKLYQMLKSYETKTNELTSDQHIFNLLNKEKMIEVKHLEYIYNCPSITYHYLTMNNFIREPVIIHFTLSPKPWDFVDMNEKTLVEYFYSDLKLCFAEWVNLYNEMVLQNSTLRCNTGQYLNVANVCLKTECDKKKIDNSFIF